MKKIVAIAAMFLVYASGAAVAKTNEINIALWKLPLNVPAMVAINEKSYEKAFSGEYKINYVQLPSGPKQIQAMAAGKLDITEGIGAAAALVGKANGVDITIAGVNGRSPKAFALLTTNTEIKKISDINGKKAAGLRGSVVHQLFIELLEENGVDEKNVEFFPMPVAAAASALLAKQVDVALLVGTEIKRAQDGGARILADGTGHLEGLSLIVVRSSFLRANPDAVKKYLRTRDEICKKLRMSPDKIVNIVAEETGLSQKDAKNMINIYDFDSKIKVEDIKELTKTLKYLKKEKIIESEPNINEIIWNNSSK
jgi:sulfonate transport system substrate-binding protein